MTTATPGSRTARRGALVLGPLAATLLVGGAATVLGAVLGGGSAAAGAAIGTAMVSGFFGLGAAVLAVVARAVPAASLLVALLTYTLQVVLVAFVFAALSGSGALDSAVDRGWLGGTVIAGTAAWLVAQITVAMRVRQPLYDLPSEGQEASVR